MGIALGPFHLFSYNYVEKIGEPGMWVLMIISELKLE